MDLAVFWECSERCLHLCDGIYGYSCECPAPPCMDNADGGCFDIQDKNGDTIGGEDPECYGVLRGDKSVCFGDMFCDTLCCIVDMNDSGTVNLTTVAEVCQAGLLEEDLPVHLDCVWIVVDMIAEIEGGVRGATDTTVA